MSGKLIPLRRVHGAPEEMSDEALLAACATGERAALGALFDRYCDRVYRFLRSRAHISDPSDIDDLVQQAFVTISKNAGKFAGRSAVSTWIFGIANNIARHYIRSESRRRRLLEAVSSHQLTSEVSRGDGVAGAERRRTLRLAIDALPDALREAFALVYLEGLGGRDAAQIIGCREGTLYKRLHQARATLREQLGERGDNQ